MKRVLLSCALFAFGVAVALYAGGTTSAAGYTPQSPVLPDNVYKIISAHKDLSAFMEMIGDAGLEDMFTAKGTQVTVFAPTNDALDEISSSTMRRIKENQASLQSFVKYHVIAGSLVLSSAIRGRRASPASANGETLFFDGTSGKGLLKINDATLVQADLQANNGVVHVVSTALVPPSLAEEQKKEAPKPVVAAPVATPPANGQPPTPLTATGTASATATGATPEAVTTTGAMEAPSAAASTTTPDAGKQEGGFELFGHKFGW